MTMMDEILSDVSDEYQRLDDILANLTEMQWLSASDAPGWTIRDVVVHLAISEEGVATSIADDSEAEWTHRDRPLDTAVAEGVAANQAPPAEVLTRWRAAADASLKALATADPERKVAWAAAPLKPTTLATTRLAEHWAHALDITTPLSIDLPDTDRLRHIAWLGHSTIPYGAQLRGIEAQPVRAELTGPNGDQWKFGPDDAASRITGAAAAFCRVGAQRLTPEESGLRADGPFAEQALAVLRNYAA